MCCLVKSASTRIPNDTLASRLPTYKFENKAENLPYLSFSVVKCLMSSRSRILLSLALSTETLSIIGVRGVGSNFGVGILDELLLSHGKARRTTERLAKVESPSLLLL